jgi:predicted Zn-dependent protease
MVSPEQVMQQSLQYYDEQNREARAKGQLVTGGPEWSRVNAIMLRLVPPVSAFRPDAGRWPWQLVLIDEDTVNAHVMAGGKITVYTGLLRKLRLSDDEIAAVMGHEMAHALREHTREKMSQAAAGDLAIAVGGALLGVGQGAVQLAGLGKQLALDLPFSRHMESEADLFHERRQLGPRGGLGVRPCLFSASFTPGSFSTLTISWFQRSSSGAGVLPGATKAYQFSASKPG